MPIANEVTKTEWKHRLEQWQVSGQTIGVWCRENNIPIRIFYYWRAKLMPLSVVPRTRHNKFVELVDKTSGTSGISVECCDVKIYLARDFHPESLINCLKTLQKL